MSLAMLGAIVALELWAVMSLAWLVQRVTGNSGWVDVAWSFGTGIAGVTFALAGGEIGWRQIAVAGLVAAWSLRLGGHIWLRASAGIDDPRYAALREEWGAAFAWRLYVFLMIQAAVAFGLAVSMGLAAGNPGAFGVLDVAGVVVLVVAIAGEGGADAQPRSRHARRRQVQAHARQERRARGEGRAGGCAPLTGSSSQPQAPRPLLRGCPPLSQRG